MDLYSIWYLLIGIMFTCYAVLDGFDLGVGALHLFTRGDKERRVLLNSIGPVWDGNEVWFVVGVGSLFGAFPDAYAAAFSGFYLSLMILLVGLIFRGVAIELRSKEIDTRWRRTWDFFFAFGSVVPPVVFGIMLGNMVMGLPIGADKELPSLTFAQMLHPYPILIGLFVLSLFTLHGAMYLNLKTEGELQAKVKRWAKKCFYIFLVMYALATASTIIVFPHMVASFAQHWFAWVLAVATGLAVANIPRTLHKGYEYRALLNCACVIAGTIFLFGIGLFPTLLRSSIDPAFSLTAYNTASTEQTLRTMLWMAIVGIPFVCAYTLGIYWVFRGKVKVDKNGY